MGPSGVRSLLLEMHTLKFNTRLAQYTEAVFQLVSAHEKQAETTNTLHAYVARKVPSFGNFGDPQRYAGFVPSEHYLAEMMNKAIEANERDAVQHTACLAVDQIAIDDSHKVFTLLYSFLSGTEIVQVNKHIAKIDGVSIFGALFTAMTSHYIRAQALTLTKSHEERAGPLGEISKSLHLYGYDEPLIAFSDDPIKVEHIIFRLYISLNNTFQG